VEAATRYVDARRQQQCQSNTVAAKQLCPLELVGV
jgi:hypothetical protein